MVKLEVGSTNYCVQIPIDVFAERLVSFNVEDEWLADKEDKRRLDERLKELEAYNVEYDGHFGPNVFFTIHADDDTEELRAKIQKVIEEFIS